MLEIFVVIIVREFQHENQHQHQHHHQQLRVVINLHTRRQRNLLYTGVFTTACTSSSYTSVHSLTNILFTNPMHEFTASSLFPNRYQTGAIKNLAISPNLLTQLHGSSKWNHFLNT